MIALLLSLSQRPQHISNTLLDLLVRNRKKRKKRPFYETAELATSSVTVETRSA